MKLNNTVVTLALLGVLALAALAGGLLPAGDPVHAADPTIDLVRDTECTSGDRCVEENTPPGVNIGAPVSATDADEFGDDNDDIEFGDTLTYSLGGDDAASFDIDPSTGQLITKAPLNEEADPSYSVTVTVKDSSGGSVEQPVAITVTQVAEAPGALAAPTVVSTDSDSNAATFELKVIWYAPDDTGDGVTGYDVEYKKNTAVGFTDLAHGDATSANIIGLDADTSYQVRVRATNAVNPGPWSLSGAGSTNKEDNILPTFAEGDSVARTMLENAAPGLYVGAPVSAGDTDNVLPLTYRLHGPDADSFDLHTTSGLIRTKRGVAYDFETKPELSVTVTVSDGQGGSDARAVTISVTDVPEAPARPARPTVRATPRLSTSLDVSWIEPDNMGPPITGYDVRYLKGGGDSFTVIELTGTGTTYTIAPMGDAELDPGASYEASVRAKNGEIYSQWSTAGTGRTSIGNSEPVFDDRPNLDTDSDGNLEDATTMRTVAENTRAGQSVGRAVRAVDGNGDRRTYRLAAADGDDAPDVSKFDINESTGQILTKEPLNHEDVAGCGYVDTANPTQCTYTVKVQVWDGLDGDRNEQDTSTDINDDIIDDEITVTITVSDDRAEKPPAPTVTVTSSQVDGTSLVITWNEPANTGPPITGYRLECTGHEVPDGQCPTDIATSDVIVGVGTHNITGLTAFKSYQVRVRADNDEGEGVWSSSITQSTNKEDNALPMFIDPPDQLYVAENAASNQQQVTTDIAGTSVVALRGSDNDSLTFRLEGPGAGRFDIDRNGQITTRSKLNFEDPECNLDGDRCSYEVRVKLSDPNGGSVFHSLTIDVTNKPEPPSAPPAPKPPAPRVTATAGSGWSLEVTWNEPSNTGPPITGYQIRYRKYGDADDVDWRQWPPDGSKVTDRGAKITTIGDPDGNNQVHLEPRKQYEVQVRALNGEGDPDNFDANPHDNWSTSGRGTTGASNRRPTFGDTTPSLITREVDENTRSGQTIGSAVEATDPDSNRLTYTLEGPGKDSFTITSTGQIRTRSPLNYEERSRYSVTVKVNDGERKDNSVAAQSVSITVLDRPESPAPPRAPTVAGVPGSTDSVRVTWDEPTNQGPPITRYSVQYAVSGSRDAFERVMVPIGSADMSVIITGLTAGTRYNVQVRAECEEVHSDWSSSGTGSPNPDVANRNPAFSGGSLTFSIAENTPPSTDVGSLVAALDPDPDVLTYILEGIDANSFDIIATNGAGQIQTKAALNHEQKSSYSVAVRVRDGRGGTDAVSVTIRVTDEAEAPDTPFAPTVTTASSASLSISWDAPDNTGPPITDYDYRYRAVTDSAWTEVTNTSITTAAVTIEGLTPSTSYDVEVRAKSAEGTSDWSNPGNGSTAAPGANSPPVFAEGQSATRSVSASAPTGTSIGLPVAATDADSGDTLTYSLEGRDAASFAINERNGQILTKSGVTLLVGETYTVIVAADDRRDIARITVSIEATAAPPNNAPVFSEGASATRSVASSEPAGTAIGDPVTATDADAGTTLNYTLEGTDAASFNIRSTAAGGQLLTRSGVTLDQRSYTVEVVASDGTASDRITVTINVILNVAPVFSEGASATRSVASSEPAGTAIGDPVTATDADAGTTLNYTLEGTDAASFAIDSASGQLLTRSGVTLVRSRYTVEVVASDGTASARITVTINVDLNTAPEFASSSTSRFVVEQGSIGDNVGAPVTATDADQGDELTYILGGADAASFSIVAASGQIRSAIMLDEETRSSYTVTVTANDGTTDSDPITVTISVTDVTYGCATGGAIADARNTGLMRDCEALLEARNKLENGARILNWSHVNPITSWQGVYFGGTTSRVTKVIVRRGGLAGTVAAELGDVDMLTELNLHSNRLSGEIPSDLANLYRLEKLLLHNNQLTGTIPDLSGLRSLKMLWLSGRDMNLTGGVPSWLNSMSSLESVSLWGNSLGGPIPVLTGMTSVNLLKLQSNGLTDAVPAWFADMSSLRILYLHDNNLTGTIPAAFGLHTGLVRFWLDRNNLTGSIPAALGRMTSLRTLNLRDNRLSGSIPPELGNLSNLQHLRLHNNQLSGSIPAALGDMSSLRQLWVSNNHLSGSIPAALGNLSSLQQLNLHTNQLSGDIPSALGRLSNLTRLRIGGVDGNRGNIGLFGCVPAALRNATDADDLALAGANGISISP